MASNMDKMGQVNKPPKPTKQSQPRQLDVFIYNDMNLLDVAGPVQAFQTAILDGEHAYHHRYLSRDGGPVKACCGLKIHADGRLEADQNGHDLLIPGGVGVDGCLADKNLQWIIGKWFDKSDDNRIISICSAALLVANSGLLDGQKATTHWGRDAQSAHMFPKVYWDLDKIFIQCEEGRLFTSAGITTGIDLALSIIGQDLGAKAALHVAQELVVYLKRNGGQSQFSSNLMAQYNASNLLEPLIDEIDKVPSKVWTLDAMADWAGLNARTLSRKFQTQFGVSPVDFVEQIRLDKARTLMNEGHVLKQVASQSGFGDVQRMRRAFKRKLGVNLQDYVKGFG
jgi:transcriptional regulator GlxA family with amidase domain